MPNLTESMPGYLRERARRMRLGADVSIPALIALPDWQSKTAAPIVLWMHGRTVSKEIDPGRYLRWLRAGIGACAVDLPGHGERFDRDLQDPERTLEVVLQMVDEIDIIVDALRSMGQIDMRRLAIGGMSAGGMAALVRLCRDHPFVCTSVEATTGSWMHQRRRMMLKNKTEVEIAQYDPIQHLDGWREIPVQVIHAEHDEWVSIDGQREFLDALRARYVESSKIELVSYANTGAPHEHAGFGKYAAEAKNVQRDFLVKWLL